jgi:hypothetical protein
MNWPTQIIKTTKAAASSKTMRTLVLGLSIMAPIIMLACVWEVRAASTQELRLLRRTSTSSVPTVSQATPGLVSTNAMPNDVTPAQTTTKSSASPAPAGISDASCQSIATTGSKDLNSLNSQVSQALTQAKQAASTGNFSSAGVFASQANLLGAQGARDQKQYTNQLNADHCNSQYAVQLTSGIPTPIP